MSATSSGRKWCVRNWSQSRYDDLGSVSIVFDWWVWWWAHLIQKLSFSRLKRWLLSCILPRAMARSVCLTPGFPDGAPSCLCRQCGSQWCLALISLGRCIFDLLAAVAVCSGQVSHGLLDCGHGTSSHSVVGRRSSPAEKVVGGSCDRMSRLPMNARRRSDFCVPNFSANGRCSSSISACRISQPMTGVRLRIRTPIKDAWENMERTSFIWWVSLVGRCLVNLQIIIITLTDPRILFCFVAPYFRDSPLGVLKWAGWWIIVVYMLKPLMEEQWRSMGSVNCIGAVAAFERACTTFGLHTRGARNNWKRRLPCKGIYAALNLSISRSDGGLGRLPLSVFFVWCKSRSFCFKTGGNMSRFNNVFPKIFKVSQWIIAGNWSEFLIGHIEGGCFEKPRTFPGLKGSTRDMRIHLRYLDKRVVSRV